MTTEQTAENPRLARAIDVILRMQSLDLLPAAAIEAFMPQLVKDARLLLAAIDGPEPTWRDVFKAARAAGWTPELWMPGQVHWGRRNEEGFIEHQHGWAKVRRPWKQPSRLVITLNGPGPDEDAVSSATLINPTPVQVLTVARALGLGGDSDA